MILRNIILVLLFSLAACAPSASNSKNSMEVVQSSLADLRSIQAEATAQQSQLQEDLRALVGRVEELEYRLKGRAEVSQQAQSGFAQGGYAPPPAIGSPPAAVNNQTTNNNNNPNAPIPVLRPATQPQLTQPQLPPTLANYDTPPPIVPLNELVKDEQQVRHLDVQFSRTFTDVLYFIRRGEFRQALTLLDEVLSASQGKEGHAQALFWQGVSSDGIGDNRQALTAYNAVISKYPNTDRARISLLRLASVFIRLGDIQTARISLQKLIAEAPSSKEADQARLKLKDL